MATDVEKIGKNIKKLRNERGVTQRELGEATGMCREHIADIERAKFGDVGIVRCLRVARALGVSLSSIAGS